jgi:hypothetical protein
MRCWLVAAAVLASAPQSAATELPSIWLCGLSDDLMRLVCVADEDPAVLPPPAAVRPAAVVNGTRFPLDPQRRWVIDLWSPPSDLERLETLAQASMCFRSPGCRALLVLSPALRHSLAPR